MRKIKIYHGSEYVVTPTYGLGKKNNDYGLGFYCTEHLSLAKEWACANNKDGYANAYELDLEGLTILNLNSSNYNILNWLAILLENRQFEVKNGTMSRAKEYILKNFLPDYKIYDIIKGYRADDSYFAFVKDFLNNSLPLSKLKEAMRLGKLGEQVVLKSEKSFYHLKALETIPAKSETYYIRHSERDTNARNSYSNMRNGEDFENEVYIMDIIREKWTNEDFRLQ